MTDVRSRLQRVSEQVRPPEDAFERMVGRRERKRRTARVASAAVAVVIALAFVGGAVALLAGLAPDRARPASGGPGEGESPPADERGGPFDEERIAEENREVHAYISCMDERGWDLPEPEVWEGPPHPGLLDPPMAIPEDPDAADRYFRDSAACGYRFYDGPEDPHWGQANGDREYDEARIAEENREVREYMGCMRARGWSLPEPEVWEGPPHPGLLTPPHGAPAEPAAADPYFRDSAECGVPYWDESGNLLPAEG